VRGGVSQLCLSRAPCTHAACPPCPMCVRTHRVSAHFVDAPGRGGDGGSSGSSKPTTTILIKFDPAVMQRQAALDAAKRG
jgi:hypothetical protein